MKYLIFVIFITVFFNDLYAVKYQSAEKLSRKIPVISMPKINENSSFSFKTGTSINDTYSTSYPIAISYGKKFSKFFGFIIDGAYYFDTDSSLKNSIDDAFKNASSKVLLPEYTFNKAHFNIGLMFKPIYGKISFFSEKIIHFDLYLNMLGGITYNIVKRRDENTGLLNDENKFLPSVMFIIGQNYFLTDSLALGLELVDNITLGEMFDSGSYAGFLNQNFSIRIGLNYIF